MQANNLRYPRNDSKANRQWKSTNIFLAFLCLLCFSASAQNLVPNPGFENYSTCPTSNSFPVTDWFNPNTATPDYFTPCGTGSNAPPNVLFGPQTARSGNSFAGAGWYSLGGGFYDYMQVQLSTAMTAGTVYSVSAWVCLANGVKWASDDVGIHISTGTFKSSATMAVVTDHTLATTPTGFGVFNTLIPQIKCPDNQFITDTMNWTLVSGTYTATGGENAITLGCFENWATTGTFEVNTGGNGRCYYYFDDVSVEALVAPAQPSAIAGATGACPLVAQTYSVAPVSGATSYVWNLPSGWTGTSTSHSISVIPGTTGGIIGVAAVNQGGTSSVQQLTVTVTNIQASITQSNAVLQTTVSGSYQWVNCDNNFSVLSAGSQTFAPVQSGSYAVIISRNGCVDTSACLPVTVIHTALSEAENNPEYTIFPNPASNTVSVRLPKSASNPEIQLTDHTGHTVYRDYADNLRSSDSLCDIPLQQVSQGVYFIQLIYPDRRSAIRKIVIIK